MGPTNNLRFAQSPLNIGTSTKEIANSVKTEENDIVISSIIKGGETT